jgi:hypothetical protein
MSTENTTTRQPIPVTKLDSVFGGNVKEILPPYDEIPSEFKRQGHPWVRWQQEWFFHGLKSLPTPKEGIDGNMAIANLACVQGSFEPKHEHKEAGVAYLASLWFEKP